MTETWLITISKFSWFAELFALAIVFALAVKNKKNSSSLVALLIMIVFGGFMREYSPYLLKITNPEYKNLVRFMWYMGFVSLDATAMYILYKSHNVFAIRYSIIAKITLLAFYAKGQLHLLRYAERMLGDTQYLQAVYQSGIPAINIGMATTALFFALAMAVSTYRNHQGKEGLTWTL